MKTSQLTPADASWLTATMERNRRRFGGWSMEGPDDPDKKADPEKKADDPDNKPDPEKKPDPDKDKGFPADTKPEDMNPEQQAAYYKHQARKHEDRNKDILKRTRGKVGDDLQAELDELDRLRKEKLTPDERAVEDVKNATRAEVRKEFGSKLAAAEFRAALAHVDGERRDQIIEGLSLEKYLTTSGDVDTDKVKSYAATLAPADKGTGDERHDYGGGRREHKSTGGSVSQIMADRAAARAKK